MKIKPQQHAFPIGLDLGTATVKAVQVRPCGETSHVEVGGAATLANPLNLRADAATLKAFFCEQLRPMLDRAGFIGRPTVLSLPPAMMTVQRLRFSAADAADLAPAVLASAPQWVPYPLRNAVVRHIDAGEVFEDGKAQREVIAIAAPRDLVVRWADAADAAKLDVIAVLPEAIASLATLTKLDRQHGSTSIRFLIDAGHSAVRVYAARGRTLLFTHVLAGTSPEQLRAELSMCRHYLETTFVNNPVTEAVFTGGRTADREWSRELAAGLNLPARVIGANACLPFAEHVATELQSAAQSAGAVWSVAAGLSLIGGADAASTSAHSLAAA